MVKIYKQPFAHDGDTIAIPDASQPDGKISSADGWTPDYQLPKTDPNYKPVGRQEMNGVFKEVTEALGQVQVQGAASWSADGAPYPINAQVYHNGKQWISLRANSVEPAEGEDWSAWGDSLRQDLANPDKGAAMVARGVVVVDSVIGLPNVPAAMRRPDLRFIVGGFYSREDKGGGEFYWDASSTAEEIPGIVIAAETGGSGRFVRDHQGTVTGHQVGLPGDMDPKDRCVLIQRLWDWAAVNKVKVVMGPETHVVHWNGPGAGNAFALQLPGGTNIHFMPGFLLTKPPYQEDFEERWYRILTISSDSNGSTLSGRLEIDGQGDTVSWYYEHNHCLFIFGASDIDMSGLHIVAYNAMGDSVSWSGGDNADRMTRGVRIGSMDLTRKGSHGLNARRKSLVIEALQDCHLGWAVLDNGPDNCMDFEPFGLQVDKEMMSLKIDYLKCRSGIDFTAGTTPERERVAKMYIDTLVMELPEGSTKTGPMLLSYSANVQVGNCIIDYRKATSEGISGVNFAYAAKWFFDSLTIYVSDYVYGGEAIKIQASAGGSPEIFSPKIEILGRGNKSVNPQGRLTSVDMRIEGVLGGAGESLDYGMSRVTGSMTAREGALNVSKLIFTNVAPGDYLFGVANYLSRTPTEELKIGSIVVVDNATDGTPHGSVVRCYSAYSQEQLTVGGITCVGRQPTDLLSVPGGGAGFIRLSGGIGSPSRFYWLGATPEGVIPAVVGSTCTTNTGKLFMKAGESGLNTGWREVALLDVPAP